MRWRAALVLLVCASPAFAQKKASPKPPPPPPPVSAPTNLRARVGAEHAGRLMQSEPDRIRGIARAASLGTPEAIGLLVDAVERESGARLRADSRALLATARGLARYADQERARAGLLAILGSGNPGLVGRVPSSTRPSDASSEETDPAGRAELAREIAAIALARWGGDRAHESLYGIARAGGSGRDAALLGLSMYPPREAGFFGTLGAAMPVPVIRMLGRLGDLRAIDVLTAAARSADVPVRGAAIVALAELGDTRATQLARAAIVESDIRLREASGEAFILLGAPERFKATAALLADDATTGIGLAMAERVHGPEITKLVAARAHAHPDRQLRSAAIRALGRSPDPEAARALVAPPLLADAELAYEAVLALARSPAPNAGDLVDALFPTRLASLAARAYVVRQRVRGERSSRAEDAIAKLAASRTPAERALGVFCKIAIGRAEAEDFLASDDVRVRRAAAAAAPPSDALLARLGHEPDPIAQQLLAFGLAGGDPKGLVKTSVLALRATAGGGDAPLAAFALARRADEGLARTVGELLASKDAVLRGHVARGLGLAPLPDATGRLADAYAWETEPEVRRAVVAGLAARTADARAPSRIETLTVASETDPDGPVRVAARRARDGIAAPAATNGGREVAWLRVVRDGGAPPGEAYAGSVVRPDGVAVPVLFDEEGHALVLGLDPGEARLLLAPRIPRDKGPAK